MDDAEHFLAWHVGGGTEVPVGTARMRHVDGKAKAERVAVLESERGLGVGRALMNAIEARARAAGLQAVGLHAQVTVIPFYEKLGYTASGEIFEEAGIDHRSMTKKLTGPAL